MSKQEAIRNAARAVKAHGFSIPADLDKQIAGLENPQYRVAVVGEYQVGKSTLINRVFLGDKPLLTEGRGLCTTAVATDIEYGPDSKMEVFDWADNSRTTERLVNTVPNPTEDDVNAATVSSSMETRAELAKKRARVCIQGPNDALKGFTIIDTPGLDDPNKELLDNTTWRIIPSADVALLVVDGSRMLGDRPLNLLSKGIMGKNGIARLMVLASYKPQFDLDEDGRKAILSTIEAQLKNIGRENIPVKMYCFEPAVEDIMSDVSEIRLDIRTFLSENAMPGREEKVANLLRFELEKDLADIAAKLMTAGKSDAERAALAVKVDAEVARFKEKAELEFNRFQDEVNALNAETKNEVELAVSAVFEEFLSCLSEKDNVGAMKKYVESANTKIKSDLQDKISIIALKLKSDINSIVARYGKSMEGAGRGWNGFISEELGVKTGMVAKMPPLVWDAINVMLMNLILPGGWLVAILGHMLGKPIFDPTTFVAEKLIVAQVKKGLEEAKPEVCNKIMQQVEADIQKTFNDVKTAMESSNRAQVEAIRSVLSGEPADSGDRAALQSAKVDLESALAAL